MIIDKRVKIEGKAFFDSNVIIHGKIRFHQSTRFYKKTYFKDDVKIDGISSLQDAIIENLTVTNCVSDLCIENLSVSDLIVSGTLSINDAVIQTLNLPNGFL